MSGHSCMAFSLAYMYNIDKVIDFFCDIYNLEEFDDSEGFEPCPALTTISVSLPIDDYKTIVSNKNAYTFEIDKDTESAIKERYPNLKPGSIETLLNYAGNEYFDGCLYHFTYYSIPLELLVQFMIVSGHINTFENRRIIFEKKYK